jgi:hypothetical protein
MLTIFQLLFVMMGKVIRGIDVVGKRWIFILSIRHKFQKEATSIID